MADISQVKIPGVDTPYDIVDKTKEIINLTLAEYQALTPEEQTDSTKWYNITDAPIVGGATNLSELDDVNITNPIENQVLKFNGTEWENSSGTSGSAVTRLIITYASALSGSTVTLSHSADDKGPEAEAYSFTATSSGKAIAEVNNLGTWDITEGLYNTTTTVELDYVGAYEIYISPTIYGFKITGTESVPANMISYHVQYDGRNVDNYDYTPCQINLTTGIMDSGSWNLIDDFFIPRSCMLGYDGVVDYYLNEDNEALKEDGTPSDYNNSSYDGNVMMEWGRDGKKIWTKIVPNSTPTSGATIYVSNAQLDSGFTCYPFYDANGVQIPHCYTPKYNGSTVNGKLRSISGLAPTNTQTGATEVTYALVNNETSAIEWYIEVMSDRQMIDILLLMIGASCNTQAKFGEGYTAGGSSASSLHNSGTCDGRGQWYGTSSTSVSVKVFGMENYWGNIWRRTAGWLNVSGTQKIKLTYSTVDGSTQTGYDATGSGYITISNSTPSGTNGGYISTMLFTDKGLIPTVASGSATTYYADGLWFNNSQTNYAVVGGPCSAGSLFGALCVALYFPFSTASWPYGAAVSCKPLASKFE